MKYKSSVMNYQSSGVRSHVPVVNCKQSDIYCRSSIMKYKSSVANYQSDNNCLPTNRQSTEDRPSVMKYKSSVMNYQSSILNCKLFRCLFTHLGRI